MLYEDLLSQGKIEKVPVNLQEIRNIMEIARRDLKDAKITALSPDWRFSIAYNAVLQCATVIVRCLGYRTKGKDHHYSTFCFLRETIPQLGILIDYFDYCRKKRHSSDYDRVGAVSLLEAEELIGAAEEFMHFAEIWLEETAKKH